MEPDEDGKFENVCKTGRVIALGQALTVWLI